MNSSTVTNPSGAGRAMKPSRLKELPRVFLAEDDPHLRHTLSEALWEAGYQVYSASSGHEILRLLAAASRGAMPTPDILVMDVRMPSCSGMDVLRAVRLAEWKQPIVMITGVGDPELRERAASLGASVVLDKPFDSEELVSMMDLLLRLSHCPSLFPPDDEEIEPEPETVRSKVGAADS